MLLLEALPLVKEISASIVVFPMLGKAATLPLSLRIEAFEGSPTMLFLCPRPPPPPPLAKLRELPSSLRKPEAKLPPPPPLLLAVSSSTTEATLLRTTRDFLFLPGISTCTTRCKNFLMSMKALKLPSVTPSADGAGPDCVVLLPEEDVVEAMDMELNDGIAMDSAFQAP